MASPIFSLYRGLIVKDKLSEEYSKFKSKLNISRRDYSKNYNEEEKKIYLFPLIDDGQGTPLIDASSESYPISFYDRIKRKIHDQEEQIKNRIREGFESREYSKDRQIFLDYLYKDCISLITTYEDKREDSELADHTVIIRSLKRIKRLVNELYQTAKLDPPSSISDPNEFNRKMYKKKDISQDEIVEVVRELLKKPRFSDKGEPKPTTLRDEILNKNLVNNCEELSPKGLFNRVKDAIEEILFYEAESTS